VTDVAEAVPPDRQTKKTPQMRRFFFNPFGN